MTHRSQRRLGRSLALLGLAFSVGVAARRQNGRELDERFFKWANAGVATPGRDRIFSAITELGSFWSSLSAAGVIAISGRRRAAARALGAGAATWAIGQGLKRLFNRPRPYDAPEGSRLLIDRPQGQSWPSSHPAVLLAFATVASRELGISAAGRTGVVALAGLVASSRVYLGVHYPSDVVGGLLIGRAIADAWPGDAQGPG
ncbi:MAG: phosphatase PAP2 family protein [Actinomycetota bacterium]